jgi:hypothetical protein
MADKRISQLVERTDIENNDVLPIVASGATTTNKVTISTIQDWMQDNLDVGVTSVGITLGTTGTDVNVTGSPITTSGNITINIPTASATNRGLLSSADWSTFNNKVPYTGATSSVNLGNNSLSASQININGASPTGGSYLGFKHSTSVTTGTDGYTSMYTFGTNNIGFQSVSGATQKDFSFSMVNITAGVPGGRTYNLPDASGTLALTSDITSALTGYVTLDTAQTITGSKTFNSRIIGQDASLTGSGSADTLEVAHTSGSGIAVDISKAGNGEGLRVAKTSGSGNAVTITGGALSAVAGQFSGDLQSSTRLIAAVSGESIVLTPNLSSASNRIESAGALPLALVSAAAITMAAGGTTPQITLATTGAVTLTGALNGTSASFSGNVSLNLPSIGGTREIQFPQFNATNAKTIIRATGTSDFRQHLDILMNTAQSDSAPTQVVRIANTGAATFSSSVTANELFIANSSILANYVGVEHRYLGTLYGFSKASANDGELRHYIGPSSGWGGKMTFYTDTIERMRITSAGNVGIGTAANTTGFSRLVLNGSSVGSESGIQVNYNGSTFGGFALTTLSAAGGGMSLYTYTGNVGSESYTERMRITSGGNILVNTTSDNGARFQVNGVISQNNYTYHGNNDGGNLAGATWITTGITLTANHLGSYEVYVNGHENGQNQCIRIYNVFYNIYTGWGAVLVSTNYIGNDYGWVDLRMTSGGTIQVKAGNSVSTGVYRISLTKQFIN